MKRIAPALAFVMLGVACSDSAPSTPSTKSAAAEATSPAAAPSRSERFIVAEAAEQAAWLDVPARTLAAPDAQALIGVPLAARVTRIRVRPGESVQANAAIVDVVIPELVRAAGALSAAALRANAHQARLSNLRPLVEQGLARAADVAEIEAQLAAFEAERQSARATLRAAGVSDADAANLIQSGGVMVLRSPIAGTVTAVHARIGEHREPAAGALVEVTRGVAAQVEARLLAELPTSVALVWLGATEAVPLSLEALSPSASAPDGARLAWLHPTDPKQTLPAGLLGRVRMVPPPSWVSLPSHSVAHDTQGDFVMTRRNSAVERQGVRVELRYGDNVLVSGIEAGVFVAQRAQQIGNAL